MAHRVRNSLVAIISVTMASWLFVHLHSHPGERWYEKRRRFQADKLFRADRTVFFIETDDEAEISRPLLCSMESAAKVYPHWEVNCHLKMWTTDTVAMFTFSGFSSRWCQLFDRESPEIFRGDERQIAKGELYRDS